MGISKQEYIKRYCNELLYRQTGELAIDADKFYERLKSNPFETVEDLDQYGFSDMLDSAGLDDVMSVDVRTGDHASFAEAAAGDFDFLLQHFDWGSEDSIK